MSAPTHSVTLLRSIWNSAVVLPDDVRVWLVRIAIDHDLLFDHNI